MSDRIFTIAIILSIVAHGVLLARETDWFGEKEGRIVKIPLLLEEQAPPPRPPPPKPKPKPKPRKAKPQNVPEQVEKVVEGDGLRSGDLVDAEVGDYASGPPEPPPPPPKPKPKVDIKKLTREYLQLVREELAKRKKYPTVAMRMGLRGRVRVSFVIQPDGQFEKIKIKRSSGQKMLDNAAIETVAHLSGHLKRPKALGRHPLKTSVTLHYQLN